MRRALLSLTLLLASCGFENVEGFYSLEGEVETPHVETCSVNLVKGESGEVLNYSITLDPAIKLKLREVYSGEGTPQRIYVKKVILSAGGYEEEVPVSATVTEEKETEITVPITPTFKIFSPLVLSNQLEDQRVVFVEEVPLTNKEDTWEEKSVSVTFNGSPVTISEGKRIENVRVTFDSYSCYFDGSSFTSPCTGNVDLKKGEITVSVDPSLLAKSHEKTVKTTGSGSYYLSAKVVAGSVKVSNDSLGILLTDDGSGNLTGTGSGSIDYEKGTITLNVDPDRIPKTTTTENVSTWVSFESNGQLKVKENVTPLSFRMEVTDSTDVNDTDSLSITATCSDDGNGNLIGSCSGTINYQTGEVSYTWDSGVTGANVRVSYTYSKEEVEPVELTVSWESEDNVLSATVSYDLLKDTARKEFSFYVPQPPYEVKLYDREELLTSYTTSLSGNLFTVTLSDYPKSDLKAVLRYERTYDFNPSLTVVAPYLSIDVPVKVTVVAELEETKRELRKEFTLLLSGRTCEDEVEGNEETQVEQKEQQGENQEETEQETQEETEQQPLPL